MSELTKPQVAGRLDTAIECLIEATAQMERDEERDSYDLANALSTVRRVQDRYMRRMIVEERVKRTGATPTSDYTVVS